MFSCPGGAGGSVCRYFWTAGRRSLACPSSVVPFQPARGATVGFGRIVIKVPPLSHFFRPHSIGHAPNIRVPLPSSISLGDGFHSNFPPSVASTFAPFSI